jgi:hypothetical protein
MGDESTLGLGLNNPQYQDLITKQQEAIKAANQPYGMDAGQGAIAAGLGLLPALIGGLVRGREGLAMGAQAGLAGVGSYDNILKENFDRQSKAEAANAALYGQQAQQLAQSALQDQRFLSQEKLRQQNRIELKEMFPPQVGGGGSDKKDEPLIAIERSSLAKALGVSESKLENVTSSQAKTLLEAKDRELRQVDQARNAKGQELQEAEVKRRQKQFDVKMAGFEIPGWEYDVDKKMPTLKDYDDAMARNTGTNLITMTLGEIKKSMEAGGENPWAGIDANKQEIYLQRLAEAFRTLNKAGASLTESEQELGRVVRNAQNVGFIEAMKRSTLFGKKPIESINITIPQLNRERFIWMRDRGYNPPVARSSVTVNSSVFDKLKGK